jgi:hypothetical protein
MDINAHFLMAIFGGFSIYLKMVSSSSSSFDFILSVIEFFLLAFGLMVPLFLLSLATRKRYILLYSSSLP